MSHSWLSMQTFHFCWLRFYFRKSFKISPDVLRYCLNFDTVFTKVIGNEEKFSSIYNFFQVKIAFFSILLRSNWCFPIDGSRVEISVQKLKQSARLSQRYFPPFNCAKNSFWMKKLILEKDSSFEYISHQIRHLSQFGKNSMFFSENWKFGWRKRFYEKCYHFIGILKCVLLKYPKVNQCLGLEKEN